MSKVVIYIETYNPCCYGNNKYKSHEILLREKTKIATIYLIDEKDLDKVWGDDWNDAPACCNSGTPYNKNCKIIKKDIFLGESFV